MVRTLKKYFYKFQGFFRKKPMMSYCCVSNVGYYKPTKFDQNRWSRFLRKSKFFSYMNSLNFRVWGILKKASRYLYCKKTSDIEFEWVRLISLGAMFGDDQTDKQADRHTNTRTYAHTDILLKHLFRMWEWHIIKSNKKSKSNLTL